MNGALTRRSICVHLVAYKLAFSRCGATSGWFVVVLPEHPRGNIGGVRCSGAVPWSSWLGMDGAHLQSLKRIL